MRTWLLLIAITAAIGVWLTQSNPFPIEMARKQFALESLSDIQKHNVAQALQRIDGVVLKPGEIFSFNKIVGPRTPRRGYLAAPSYLDGDTPSTVGGGICLMSSALYQLALTSGMPVTERVPHLQTVRSVLPGLDASVWYGQADLKFKNPFAFPVQLHVTQDRQALVVSLLGQEKTKALTPQRVVQYHDEKRMQVAVYDGGKRLSLDLYRLPR